MPPHAFDLVPPGKRRKLLLFGDPPGNFKPVILAVERYKPEAIILLGDLTPRQPLHIELEPILHLTEIWWIHGNHDTDEAAYLDHISDVYLRDTPLAGRNLHGRIAQIAGLQVAGLGGVFRGAIWDPKDDPQAPAKFDSPEALRQHTKPPFRWREGVSLRHRSTIFPSEIRSLAEQRADLLVTHEAPSWHTHGFSAIDDLAPRMKVRWLVHGHHHRNIDYVAEHWTRMPTACPLRAYGVDGGSFIAIA